MDMRNAITGNTMLEVSILTTGVLCPKAVMSFLITSLVNITYQPLFSPAPCLYLRLGLSKNSVTFGSILYQYSLVIDVKCKFLWSFLPLVRK